MGHAIMICVPYQGHINPFVSLALKLASKGITITFVHLEFVHHKMMMISQAHPDNVDIFSEARQTGLDIRYTTIGDGLPLEYDRDLNALDYWIYLFNNFQTHVDEFVGNLMLKSSPNVLVTDTVFAWWSAAIAKKFNLVYVSFWTEPALVFSLVYHWDLLKQNGHFQSKDNQELEIIDCGIPGVEAISVKDLMQALRDENNKSRIPLLSSFEQVKKADFILHNTVDELESHTLSALHKHQPTYAIGPVNFSSTIHNNSNNTTVRKSMKAESDCARWLDSKPPGSVLYVSFGSVVQTSKRVIQEVAHGLVLSGVNFIWVLRTDDEVLPVGFEEHVKDRGLVVPWCDQISVLSDPGVGGFLTHCGWNSTIESMWCGVPMICYPISYDQPTNRKLVVDDWKIGINLCDGIYPLDRNEVAQKIRSFFMSSGAASTRIRQEAENVKKTVRSALQIHGSSNNNFNRFIMDLEKKLCLL